MAKTKEIKGVQQFIRAQVQPNSFNKESRTFDVVFATETPVRQYNWDIGEFMEILSCDTKSVRMQRAEQGLPVFDSHYPRTAMVQLGRASDIQFKNKEGIATITLGARADEALVSDLENGIVSGISVGYQVYRYMPESVVPGQTPIYRAVDWEPGEISFAPVQADPNSNIRSKETDGNHTIIIDNYSQTKNEKMTIAEIRAKASDEQKARLDAVISIARSAKLGDEKVVELFESDKTIEVIRSENPEFVQVVPPVVDVNKIRQEATEANKTRIDAILKSTRAAKLSDTEAIDFINSDKSIEEIRQAVIEKYVATDPKVNGNHTSGVGKEAIEKKREAACEALLNVIKPDTFKITGANEYRSMSLIEIVKDFAAERGISMRGLDKNGIADMVFGGRRDMSTSDFPLLLEQLADKLLRQDYTFAPEYWSMIAKETSVRDFKPKNLYQVETKNGMQEVLEDDELKYTSLAEAKQTISVKSYAEGIKFTRRAFINDDLNAFSVIPNRFALDWNTLRGDLVWGLLTANNGLGVTMYDTYNLFDTTHHANYMVGATTNLSDTGLQAALLLFRRQLALDGKRRIRVIPKYLIVSPELEVTARKLLSSVFATKTGDINLWNNTYQLIVEPRLTDANAWYLAADPGEIDGLYYCYLDGNSGLRSNRIDDFDTDSIKFGIRGEFGAQAIDYRGWIKSKGIA